MDQMREASVWERVRAAAADAPLPLPTPSLPAEPERPDGEALSGETLLQWAEGELSRCQKYRALAGCSCGRVRQSLWCLARKAGENGRKLEALYYVRQGRRACPQTEPLPCCFQPAQLLRQLYLEELAAETAYLAAGETERELLCLGRQKEGQACELLRLLSEFV